MTSNRHRAASPYWDGNLHRDRSSSRGKDFTSSLKGLLDRLSSSQPDPTNPVINGASQGDKSWFRSFLAEIATQLPRASIDVDLIASIAKTKIFDGGLIDDKTYQMEKVVQLAASLPNDSPAQDELSANLLRVLWNNLQHPPVSLLDQSFRYRTADGSNNNLMYPTLGMAGSPYARTVTPRTLQPGVLPDAGVVFDSLFARGKRPKQHPNKISSMLFYLASIIIHDVFYTDPGNPTRVKTSSYLDLAPLYGSSIKQQSEVRSFRDGLLKPDTFSEPRLLGFPPGVSALLVCFNRYHNYVAIQLKQINEGGKFTMPVDEHDEGGFKNLDENLFQTARLVTCGLYVNIVLTDYVRTILNLNRTRSTWSLDPRENTEFIDPTGVPKGIGNQVSVEFNLVYRWHAATSIKDDEWTQKAYEKLFPGRNMADISEQEFSGYLAQWIRSLGDDPANWPIDFGRYQRTERGTFKDQDLVDILTAATEDVACAFGARQVPVAMKVLETMGIKQARAWNVATLNEFRKFFSLEPHKKFSDISSDLDVQHALKALYKEPDYVELYPGLVAEDAKASMSPGSGICLGFTASRTILSDAVALVRGDRFYTVDNSPANLTNWGFNQIKSDPEVAQGHCIYNLIQRALPGYYRGNSVYAMFPFVVPEENQLILRSLGTEEDYCFDRPRFVGLPKPVHSWRACTDILTHKDMRVPWGDHIEAMTSHDYMLGNDKPKSLTDHDDIFGALYCPRRGMDEIRRFYEVLTKQLIVIGQERLRDNWLQLDVCRDVAQPSHSVFVAKLWHIPLKAKGDKSVGVPVDKMYLAFSVMFAYVFLDSDTARSFKLRKSAKDATKQMMELCKIVCNAVKARERLPLSHLFRMGDEGQMLEDYGRSLILRMFDNGWDVDQVVANLVPTAVAAVATQAQHMTQMIDLYLSDKYKHHWPMIQKLARSDEPEAFELLKSYALEANRLAPASYGLIRTAAANLEITDNGRKFHVQAGDQVYTDFLSAGLDEREFPNPHEIVLDRPRASYIHHGWGRHVCIGRQIVEIAMAAQLKVFAQLKNLRRAPGPQGEMKYTYPQPNPVSNDPVPAPGKIKAFMKEDWSDFWPFPTSLKVHHDGFDASSAGGLGDDLMKNAGLPGSQDLVIASSRENSRSRSRSRGRDRVDYNSKTYRNDNKTATRPHHHRRVEDDDDDEEGEGQEEEERESRRTSRRNTVRINSYQSDLAYGDVSELSPDKRMIDISGILSSDSPTEPAVKGFHLNPRAAEHANGDSHPNGQSR